MTATVPELQKTIRERNVDAVFERMWLASIVESSDDAIVSKNLDGIITSWNKSAERLFGFRPEEAIGKPVTIIIPPERVREEDMILDCIRRGERVDHFETVRQRKDGARLDISLTVSPIRGPDGKILGASKIARDITEGKRIREELRKSEERFRSSVVQSPVPTILFDDREEILTVSRSWLNAAGDIPAAELSRIEDWTTRAFGERSGEALNLIREIIATEPEGRVDEMTVRTRGGDRRIWNFVTSSLGTKSDGRHLFLSVAQDVTDRRAYEERIDLLMREARHRTKNILGLVQVIARQTAAGQAQDFVGRFIERIQALAANQDLLVRHEWRIDVADLVGDQLQHFADLIGTRINLDGPKLHLNAAAAQAIGLALHELATNAGKYGALSTDAGLVDVSWRLGDHDTFMMSWVERNGPPVRPPERRGFGSTVIESMVEQTLGGEVRLDYAPSGLAWRVTCRAADTLEKES